MNCPKCGNEINENQKFCSNCGIKLDEIENQDEITTESIEKNRFTKHGLSNSTKKIIVAITCMVLVILLTFGIIQYKQYKKDIAPCNHSVNFGYNGNTTISAEYDPNQHKAIISVYFDEVKAEKWHNDYFKEFYDGEKAILNIKNSKKTINTKYLDVKAEEGKTPSMRYYIANVNLNYFAEIKDNIMGNIPNVTYEMIFPNVFSLNKNTVIEEKNAWLAWKKQIEAQKEAERKQKEWQEKVLSNCVYKTSDGVCFTTQVFKAKPIKVIGKNYYNYWLGAKDACESQGYKLPNDNELRSLFSDILGIQINNGTEVKTVKDSYSKIPTNFEIIKAIAPNELYGGLRLWEDKEFDNNRAYARQNNYSWETYETHQYITGKFEYEFGSNTPDTICVYDSNGKPHKSLHENIQKEAENELF